MDHFEPDVWYVYAGNSRFEGGSGAHDSGNTVYVAGGDTVPLAARVNDFLEDEFDDGRDPAGQIIKNESSGIAAVQFAYEDPNGHVVVIGLGTFDDGGTSGDLPEETWDDMWRIDWETPMNMPSATDSTYDIIVTAMDNAGNCGDERFNNAVSVQDVTPPEDSKIIAAAGEWCIGNTGTVYPFTDIDEGALDSWRGIDEAVLSQDFTGETVVGVVSREVDLFIATPAGDASMFGAGLLNPLNSDKGLESAPREGGGIVLVEGRRDGGDLDAHWPGLLLRQLW